MNQPDFLPISVAAMVNRKGALPYELFRDYWRDVHIVLGTRMRGSYLHRLHFLTFASPTIWAVLEGIEVACPVEDRFDGIAEVWYPSSDHLRRFSSNPLSKIIAEDEQNIFSRVVPYFALAGNVRTYIDVLAECPLDGPQKIPILIFCIQKVATTSLHDFRTYMADQFAPMFAQSGTALRVRLHLLEAYNTVRQSPHVSYEHPQKKQYQAWMEVMFKNPSTMAWFFDTCIRHTAINEEPGFDHVYNMSLWQYFRDHNPRSGQLFNQAMTSLSNQVNPYIASAYDFSRFETLVDVGGGEGSTLRTILHKYPQLRGVLFDQAETIEQAREHFVREKLDERCNLVAGNFLEAVPEGADAYLLKHILEGWKDEMAISILHNCRRAMKLQGKILIVEYIVTGEGALFEKLLDLQLMITTTSGCRTEEECRKLFDAAGFAMTAVVETGTPSHIFEGTPI
jgi:hypothetical protein